MGRDLFAQPGVGRDLFANANAVGVDESKRAQYEKTVADWQQSDQPTALQTAVSPLVGMARGLANTSEGVAQLGLEAGEKIGLVDSATTNRFEQRVKQGRADWEDSPYSQGLLGEVGEFTGEVAPFMVMPGGVTGGLLRRTAVNAGQGLLAGGTQFVPEGGSRATNALIGAGTGGAFTGAGAALRAPVVGVKRALVGKAGPALNDTMQAFQRSGVQPTPGQLGGQWQTQGLENAVIGALPGGAGRMAGFYQGQQSALGQRVGGIAERIAPKAEIGTAGRAIKQGIQRFARETARKAGTLYDEVDRFIAPARPVPAANTMKVLQDITTPIPGAANVSKEIGSPALARLMEGLKADVGLSGELPYAALKGLRTRIGSRLDVPDLTSDIPRAELKRVYGALSDDMASAAKAAGSQAERAFARANTFYKAKSQRIDDFLQGIAKKADIDSVYKSTLSGTKEGATKLRAIKRSLNHDEWNVVSATFLKRLGQSIPSQQGVAGEAFSTNTFLTRWNSISPQARREMFSGTDELRRYARDIDAIAKVSNAIKESAATLANPSGTAAKAVWSMGTVLAPFKLGVSGLGANVGARLMTSPKFVNWMAQTTRIAPGKLPNHLTKLTTIAITQPELAPDIEQYRAALTGSR